MQRHLIATIFLIATLPSLALATDVHLTVTCPQASQLKIANGYIYADGSYTVQIGDQAKKQFNKLFYGKTTINADQFTFDHLTFRPAGVASDLECIYAMNVIQTISLTTQLDDPRIPYNYAINGDQLSYTETW